MIRFNQLKNKFFPDGMSYKHLEDYYPNKKECITASIRSFHDLIRLAQLVDVLRNNWTEYIHLDLHYLIGSRMDRPIDNKSPNTLKVVCDVLNSLRFNLITTVFAHSSSTLDRLNAVPDLIQEKNFITAGLTKSIIESRCDQSFDLCLPDAGAAKRYWNDHAMVGQSFSCRVIECSKHRDMQTGKLSGFCVPQQVRRHCVILDDIIDAGGTFKGLANELRKNGAKVVSLVAYHGIFSKGTDLEGIDFIFTSNSFADLVPTNSLHVEEVV